MPSSDIFGVRRVKAKGRATSKMKTTHNTNKTEQKSKQEQSKAKHGPRRGALEIARKLQRVSY